MTPIEKEFFEKARQQQRSPILKIFVVLALVFGLLYLLQVPTKQQQSVQPSPTLASHGATQSTPVADPAPTNSNEFSDPVSTAEPEKPPAPPSDYDDAADQRAADSARIKAESDESLLTPEQRQQQYVAQQRAKGLVLYYGTWMTPEQREALRAAALEKQDRAQSHSTSPAMPLSETASIRPSSNYGDGYGATSKRTGLPRTEWVNGYTRKNGTVVHGYFRSRR
jgi:hypothetical protein